jgi:hypothetical protein
MKPYAIAYLLSAVWLFLVNSYLSDYRWYRWVSVGTWGFIGVEAITLLPVLAFMFAADLFKRRGSKSQRE